MVHHHGLHHFHKRKKSHPVIDKLVYFAGIFGPLMTIPQILKIFQGQNASGIAIESWAAYIIIAFIWLSYGLAHRNKPIILTNIIWIFLDIFIIAGVLIYG